MTLQMTSRSALTSHMVLLSVTCLVFAMVHTSTSLPATNQPAVIESDLELTLGAMQRALDWMESVYSKVNLDAIIGTRIVEGQLGVLINHLNVAGGLSVAPEVEEKIKKLHDQADKISREAIPYIHKTQKQYYEHIGAILVPRFWDINAPSRDVDQSKIIKQDYMSSAEQMNEEQSDDCLGELFGSNGGAKSCDVTEKCWKKMTSPGYRGYSLSHQVFYLEIGKQFGCFGADSLPLLDDLTGGFCANMYEETREIAGAGYPEVKKDLFMELPALCGMLGYHTFFTDTWLETILSWQFEQGCYGFQGPVVPKSRFKREERRLANGCQCHRTAVAVSALSQYLRYLIEFENAAKHINSS